MSLGVILTLNEPCVSAVCSTVKSGTGTGSGSGESLLLSQPVNTNAAAMRNLKKFFILLKNKKSSSQLLEH